ncbi:hypothetical protein [Anabaena sp. CCY 0017]|uniref:hypothetical protein n=1 Tax=Anabaena sp. CCY 0017 TaxID=3103866 RepID=UPI0039C6707D
MTNSNHNHELDYLNENSADSAVEFHKNGSNHRSHHATLVAEEDITPEEEQWLAGYDPTANQLISAEYRLQQDEEGAVERPLAEKPSVRLGSVVALVGIVMGSGSLLWFGFLRPKPPVPQVVQNPPPSPNSEPILDESAELKSRLAFQDQQQQLKVEPVAAKSPTPGPENQPGATPSPTPSPPPRTVPPVRPVSPRTTTARIEPAPIVRRSPSPVNSPVSYAPRTIAQPVEQPESNADPLEQWHQLARWGQSQISNASIAQTQEKSTLSNPSSLNSSTGASSPQDSDLQTVLIGLKSVDSQVDHLTPGMLGILNRKSVNLVDANAGNTKNVALGTSAPGKLIMPMIWDEGGNNPHNRFAVELTKPLTATDGTVALPAGTVVVVETTAVGKKNHLVSASGIALVYPDLQGTIKQEMIPANTLLIRSQDKQPLIAQQLHDVGKEIAQQDLLVGLLSSLGRVGSIVNQPRSQSSTVVSSGTFNQSTITSSSNPQIWAAALEGFFTPVSDRLSRRSEQALQELLQRPHIQFIPEGTEVSIVVNNFLNVER